jgi:hypothetical protein
VAERLVEGERQRRRLDADFRRRRARSRLSGSGRSHIRFLRRSSSRQQLVRRQHRVRGSEDGPAQVALPDRPPSDLGLRPVVGAAACRHHGERPRDQGGRSADQGSLPVRVRPRDRPAGVADWPKPLPNHWLLGNVIGVGVDFQDHIWIVHRGDTLDRKEIYAAANPPASDCCLPAPPVIEFDQQGNVVHAWAGPGQGFEWPESNHGIVVDSKGVVWIGGNGASDGHILKFTREGKFVKQFGSRTRAPAATTRGHSTRWPRCSSTSRTTRPTSRMATATNASRSSTWTPARSSATGAPTGTSRTMRRLDLTIRPRRRPAVSQPGALRGVVAGWVCLRLRSRQRSHSGLHEGRHVRQRSVRREEHARRRLGVGHRLLEGRAAEVLLSGRRCQREDSRLRPSIHDRAHGVRRRRPAAGQFYAVHSIATDSRGNVYTTETYEGKRLQRFVYKGIGSVAESQGVVWPRANGR